jgi:hypothetical protein
MSQTTIKDHRLTLPEVVDALVADGMIEAAEAASSSRSAATSRATRIRWWSLPSCAGSRCSPRTACSTSNS